MNEKNDRRSQRTRQALGDALVDLMMEKGYDAISVKDIIDHANVGCSPFLAALPAQERSREGPAGSWYLDIGRAIASGSAKEEAAPEGGRVMTRISLKHKVKLGKNESGRQQKNETIGCDPADSTCALLPPG